MCPFHSPVESHGKKVTPKFVQNTAQVHTPGNIAPTKHIQSFIVIYQNVRVINPEVWPPPYIPFNQPLSLQNFFTSWPLKFNPVPRPCHMPLLSIDMKTKVVQHVKRINRNRHRHRQRHSHRQSWFPAFVKNIWHFFLTSTTSSPSPISGPIIELVPS